MLSRTRDLDAALVARYPGQADAVRFHAQYENAITRHREITAKEADA